MGGNLARPLDISIVLNDGDESAKDYSGGEWIQGYLQITNSTDQPIRVKGYGIQFLGEGFITWSREQTYGIPLVAGVTERKTYVNGCTYFDEEFQLLEASSIPPGVNKFQFHFQLPEHIPSSFKSIGRSGYIRYMINLKNSYNRLMLKKPIEVSGQMDLNQIQFAKEAFVLEKELKHGNKFRFVLPKSGFVPGEEVNFQVYIANPKGKKTAGMRITLLRKIAFESCGKTRLRDKQVIAKDKDLPLNSGERERDWNGTFQIPDKPLLLTNLGGCTFISVWYLIQVEMFNHNMSGEILIGSVPVTSRAVPYSMHSNDRGCPTY